MNKSLGDNSHGNKNEQNFVKEINLGIKKLNLNLKEFIKYICKNENIEYNNNIKISSEYEPNSRLKQDLYLCIENKKIAISLKMGTGNSVHQEKCDDFISYIKNYCNASDEICDLWKFFLWADGTLDGSGSKDKNEKGDIKSRFSATEFKTMYPEKRIKLQKFIKINEKSLIQRFLFEGRHNSCVDYIYHGTPQHGSWISKEKIIEYQLENSNVNNDKGSCLSVGKMSIQSWNISRQGNSENKRGQLQVKYSKMLDDFNNLMSQEKIFSDTFKGDSEEFDLSRLMNKNKNSKLWKAILPNEPADNYYIVKVTNKPKSKLSGKKVFSKSDAYIIKSNLSEKFLLEKEYIITEKDLNSIDYKIVNNTGISIKIKSSLKYTIQKFTKESFIKAFGNEINNIEEILFSLLIYSNTKEIYKNYKIALDFNIDYDDFICRMEKKYKIDSKNNQKNFLDRIRKDAQKIISNKIKNNIILKEAIFKGKYWFEDPYYAEFIYIYGDIKKNIPNDDFIITTGSGRSKGKYSIEIKPRYK